MQLWTFLHIVSMFAAVTIAHAALWFAVWATRRGDVGALRALERVAGRGDSLSFVFLGLGITFGVAAALTGGIDLTSSWLVAAYVLVAVGVVAGLASLPYTNRLLAAVRANAGDEASPPLRALMASKWPLFAAMEGAIDIGLIIAVMVFKPTLW